MKKKEFLKCIVASILFWTMTLFIVVDWKKMRGRDTRRFGHMVFL